MKKKWLSILLALVSIFALMLGSCSSAPAPVSGGSAIPDTIPGAWRFSDLSMIGIIEIDTNGAGTFKMVDHEGNDRGTLAAAVDGSGRIQIGKTTAQYRLADVAVEEGIYLGEQMIITGWMDDPISFHKTNPSKSLTLGDTSWINPRGLPVTYIFNKDGSFRIDLGPQVQAANDALWNADTEGTYTINGIEVTLNYPNGKALKWTKASDGGINGGMEQTASQQIFIEGACSKTPEMIEKARET